MAIRSRFVVVGSVVAGSVLAVGMTMVGCSGDDTVVVVDSGPDTTADVIQKDVVVDAPPDNNTPDSGPDVVMGDDAGTIKAFMNSQADALCKRYAQCCFGADASAFDTPKCKDAVRFGIEDSLAPLVLNSNLLNGGRIRVDPVAAPACLAESATFSCPTTQATEYQKTSIDCAGALQGIQANGQPCNDDIECATGWCKTNPPPSPDAGDAAVDSGGTGTCVALSADGGPCGPSNYQCQNRAMLGSPARCDTNTNTCGPRLANGANCNKGWDCQSGTCEFATGKCQSSLVAVTSGVCDFFKIVDAGGGG